MSYLQEVMSDEHGVDPTGTYHGKCDESMMVKKKGGDGDMTGYYCMDFPSCRIYSYLAPTTTTPN